MKVLLPLLFALLLTHPATAQTDARPFILPMLDPPGPATWLLGQPYGNTVGAYLRGDQWYSAGQRLHFGLDFSMPCGTPLVAIGDGVVAFVDDMGFGSAPHNLLIRHDASYVSLYGHLSGRAPVEPGTRVSAGDLVGYSGDPDLTCDSRPHLHFEIRSLDYQTTYNPVQLIDANWHALAAIGSFSRPVFQQDLDNARRWMSIDDQPNVTFGGRALNQYAAPYPDFREGSPPENPPLARESLSVPTTATLRRLAYDGCCYGTTWDPIDPVRLYTIDGGENQRAVRSTWDVTDPDSFETIGGVPPWTSADGTHTIARISDSEFTITPPDGTTSTVNTGGSTPTLSADNSKIVYAVTPDTEPFGSTADQPPTNIYIANIDGSESRIIASYPGTSARWLDASRLLMVTRDGLFTGLAVFDTAANTGWSLGTWERLRGLSIAPGGGRVLFYLMNQADESASGVYTIATSESSVVQQLLWFGAWQWRDADRVYYVPFTPDEASHVLHVYDLASSEDRALTDPAMQAFTIADGDWTVSADGRRIAFRNAADKTTWLIEAG